MLGLVGRGKTLKPQQLLLADVVNAGNSTVGVLLPRRSTKTTTLIALALGRCAERWDYLVGYTTATTGQKARDRFRKDIVPVMERVFPDADARPFKIRKAGGSERIEFDNGSIFQILPPQGENFRSDAFDLVIVDEAGESDPEMTDDLLQGILPTFDTRPDAQLIVAGTAAKFRQGNLLWDTLVDGREGRAGIIEFAAPDDTPAEALEDWETVKALVLAAHPGVGTLTTIDIVHERWAKMKRSQFKEEYLSIFGSAGVAQFIDLAKWATMADSGKLPTPPAHFRMALVVHPLQTSASIVAAWRVKGRAQLLVLDHREGVAWVYARALELSRRYRTPVVFDSGSSVGMVEIERLGRARPKPRLEPQTWPQVSTAAGLLLKEIEDSNVLHWAQPILDEAVRLAVKRGTANSKRWAYGRANEEDDITSLEAGSLALRAYDDAKPSAPMKIVSAA